VCHHRRVVDLAIIIPLLRRPHRIAPLLADIEAATDVTRCDVLFVATSDDSAVLAALTETVGPDHPFARWVKIRPNSIGDYSKKINHGYRITTAPILFLGADDLHFHEGWLDAGLAPFADPRIGVVGTQDLGNSRVRARQHATHSLVRRSYVDEFGTIDEPGKVLHEGYVHEFVDDEFVETAKKRRAFHFANGCVVEHLHPSWGKAPWDPLYQAEPRRMQAGRRTFAARRRLWM
jgi:hypothetical protein